MKLIDKDELKLHKFLKRKLDAKTGSDIYMAGWNDAIDAIVACAPTIDLVHCKDCKWWQMVDGYNGYNGVYGHCEHIGMLIDKPIFVNKDFFCADGELEEDDE